MARMCLQTVFMLLISLGSLLATFDPDDESTSYEISESSSSGEQVLIEDDNSTLDYHSFALTTIKYYLISAPNETIELNSTNLNLVNISQPLKIIIHGVGESEHRVWIDKMATLYHGKGSYNVMVVDWSVLSATKSFFVASAVNSVGETVGNFIVEIIQDRYDYLGQVHLIGLNVGAQVGGAAGHTVAAKTNGRVDRITGLDPTQPENLQILDKDDADFVDVIHTSVSLGQKSCGTVDFYIDTNEPNRVICPNDTCGDLLVEEMYMSTIEDESRYQGISCYNASDLIDRMCDNANSAVMGEGVARNISGYYLVGEATSATLNKFFITVAPLLLCILM